MKSIYFFLALLIPLINFGQSTSCTIDEDGNNFENAEFGLDLKYIANDFDIAEGTSMEIEKIIPTIVNNIGVADIFIYEDDNGQPGNLITSFDDVTPTSQTLVSNNFNLPWYEVALDLPTSITLEGLTGGSKYWIGLTTTVGSGGGSNNFWEIKTNGTTAFTHTSIDQGATWTISPSGFDGVFQVIGQCSGEATPPMEPCSIVEVGNNFENAEFGLDLKYIANDFDIAEGTSMEIEKIIPTIVNNIGVADIFIYEDDNGQPGNLITSFDDVTPTSQTLVSNNFNLPWYEVELDLPTSITLEGLTGGSKYWIGLTTTVGSGGGSNNFWEIKTNGTTAFTHTSIDQGATWTISPSGFDGVFQVIGQCSGEATPPMEPCSLVEVGNNFENAEFGLDLKYIANDFDIAEGTSMEIEKIIPTIVNNIGVADIFIYEDDNGQPGNLITSFDDVTPTSQTLVSNNFNLPWYEVVLDLPTSITLEGLTGGSKYWIGLTTTVGSGGGSNNFWEIKTNGTTAFTHTSIDQGATWTISPSGFDGVFQVIGQCSGEVIIPDDYCTVAVETSVAPITQVTFAGIANTTSAETSSPAQEYFLNIEGTVNQGDAYVISVEGNTDGDFASYFSAFIDWNQNGILDDSGEVYEIGSITNSTGSDGQTATSTIIIPFHAEIDQTRMRIIKSRDAYSLNPCSSINIGQAEDYTLNISEVIDTYCEVEVSITVEPITKVSFADIENVTSADLSAPGHEYFLTIEGNVEQASSYNLTVEGNTIGDNTHYFTAFIDWNQNGILDDAGEVYEIGEITNSTGTDGQQATTTIEIPLDALVGNTRIRIIKWHFDYPIDPCETIAFGQAEDYTLNVSEYINPYCEVVISETVTPITNVTFAGIDNPSTADTDAPAHELFVDIHGTVAYGNEYAISLEGFTDGNNTHYFTAFFDWNQNGVLDDAGEVYQLGTITNSTGTDGIKLVKRIEVAADALEGETRMRIIKSAEGFPLDPCGEYTSGQAEDYSFSIVEYCTPDIALKAPITRVVFAGIDNTSPSDPFTAPAYEPFLDIEGNVVTGETYDVTLQGNPIWDLCYTIFIDWNQNGVLDDAGEVYQIDCVYSIPAGDQGALAHGTVEVPEDAVVGATRMRVITTSDSLTDDGFPYDPCGFYYYAQAEDYTIIVRDNPLPTCSIECPEDISVQIPVGQSSSVVTYAVTYDCDNSDNISLELTEGISSGSEFPVGVTTVRYNVEMDGEVINSCEFTVTVEDVLSTGDLQEDTFKVYPNPVVDLLNISASKSINTVQIFDLSGKKVLDINSGKRTDIIDFSRLTTGVYLVKLISEDAVNVIKVIKM